MDKPGTDNYNEEPGGVRMADVADLLGRLREDPEMLEILRTFAEVDRLYREVILTVHGSESAPAVSNSAEVLISFRSAPSDSSTPI